MKELLKLQGGYRRVMDHLLKLQDESLLLGNSLFSSLGVDFVLSGCTISNNNNGTVNIGPGLVYVSGQAIRFDGSDNVLSDGTKTFIAGPYVATDPKPFADGSVKNVYRESKAQIGDKTNDTQLVITTELYTIKSYIEDLVAGSALKGEVRTIDDIDGTFLDNFDDSGLGVTPRYLGWALRNGNNGTVNSSGRTTIAAGRFYDPLLGVETQYNAGDSGGERTHRLTKGELPTNNVALPNSSVKGRSDNANDRDVMVPANQQYINAGGSDLPHNNMQPYIVSYQIVRIV